MKQSRALMALMIASGAFGHTAGSFFGTGMPRPTPRRDPYQGERDALGQTDDQRRQGQERQAAADAKRERRAARNRRLAQNRDS